MQNNQPQLWLEATKNYSNRYLFAKDELTGQRGAGYRRIIEVLAVGRAETQDQVGAHGALLMSHERTFITGSDFLMDGGVTAAYWFVNSLHNRIRSDTLDYAFSNSLTCGLENV